MPCRKSQKTGAKMSRSKLGFEMRKIRVPLDSILPLRQIKNRGAIGRYPIIQSSIKEVGLVEPLMIHPHNKQQGSYLLLDGHLRYFALKELGESSADCIIATDDECFTYNARVSRLAPIQEHKMISKAVRNGVKPEKIAAALNMKVEDVRASLNLLNGIHNEAADLLKDKGICPKAIAVLKRVTPIRQIEIADLMISTNNFTYAYAEALFIGTHKTQLKNPEKAKTPELSVETVARMEKEMETLEKEFRALEGSYGENMLDFTVARNYVRKLLENARVTKFLTSRYADILAEFKSISAIENF
jgi:hypothetical protein